MSCSKEQCEHEVMMIMNELYARKYASRHSDEEYSKRTKKLLSVEGMNLRVSCRPCTNTGIEGNARAFMMDNPLEIILCTNRVRNEDIGEVLRHEAIHVFDYYTKKCDFMDCKGVAYSEVRAARESECANKFLNYFKFAKDFCVRNQAIQATFVQATA